MEFNTADIKFVFKREKDEYPLSIAANIVGTATIGSNVIAHLNGQLINRKNNPYNFHSICDDFSSELQECGCYMCDDKGRLRAPAKDLVSKACNTGGFIYIESITVVTEARRRDVSLLMLKACLDKYKWTLAAIFPAPLQPFPGTEFRDVVVKLSRHFARLGFKQCDESQYWILDHSVYNGEILQLNNNLAVFQKPAKVPLSSINMELLNSIDGDGFGEIFNRISFNQTVSRITSCVQRGASINETKLLHFVVANKKNNLIATLIGLGGDINLQDDEGCTPLHVASRLQNKEGTKILIELGADTTILDRKGNTHTQAAKEMFTKMMQSQLDFCRAMGIQPREGWLGAFPN